MSLTVVLITVALIAASAFFVAVEFALVAARRYRLEEAAASSRSARAALRSSRDLSMLLAGSQLGITLCVLGLGAISKPALDKALGGPFAAVLPDAAAGPLAFVLALIIITFLHLVVGEMAPKSWAIAHPELAATALALPMRGFMRVCRPILLVLNGMANWCLRRVGVQPVDEVSVGRSPADLRELVDHSSTAGALGPEQRDQLLTALDVDRAPVHALARPSWDITRLPAGATAGQVRAASRDSGHLRLVVDSGDGGLQGVVHVRDVLVRAAHEPVDDLVRPLLTLPADQVVHEALRTMRATRNQVALVPAPDGTLGLVTMQDLLDALLPRAARAPGTAATEPHSG